MSVQKYDVWEGWGGDKGDESGGGSCFTVKCCFGVLCEHAMLPATGAVIRTTVAAN